jgi:hypothetical protein
MSSKKYLIDGNNNNLSISLGYQADLVLVLNGLGIPDATGHTFAFDIGQEGEEAVFTGTATLLDVFDPQQIQLTIPAGAFTAARKRLVLQIRHTDLAAVERIIYKGFLDVLNPVTPKP